MGYREDLLVRQRRAARRQCGRGAGAGLGGAIGNRRHLAERERIAQQRSALELADRLVALAAKAEDHEAAAARLALRGLEVHLPDSRVEPREELLHLRLAHLWAQASQPQSRRRAFARLVLAKAPPGAAPVEHLMHVAHRAGARGVHLARHVGVPRRSRHGFQGLVRTGPGRAEGTLRAIFGNYTGFVFTT